MGSVIIIVVGGAYLRTQATAARAALEQCQQSYEVLLAAHDRQAAAVADLEAKAAEAALRGAVARREAQGAVDVATRSAEALSRVMAGARPGGECPTADAVGVVREDLAQ
jgi:hypothetical protein